MKENWKLYTVVICIGIGGLVETLRSISTNHFHTRGTQVDRAEVNRLDLRPYVAATRPATRPSFTRKAVKSQRTKKTFPNRGLNRLMNSNNHKEKVESTDFNKKKTKTKGKFKKGQDKKKLAKKKEAEKKAAEKKAAELKKKEEERLAKEKRKEEEEENESDYADSSSPQSENYPAHIQNDPKKDKNDEGLPVTLEDWYPLVLDQPHFKNTNMLVDYFRSNVITAELFYQILNLMIDDERDLIKQYGIDAAGNVVGAESFKILIKAMDSPATPVALVNRAKLRLQTYYTVAALPLLQSVLSTSTSSLTLVEASSAVESISRRASEVAEEETASQEEGTPRREIAELQPELFNSIIPVLQELVDTNIDASVISSAQAALNSISNFTGIQTASL